MRVFIMEQFKDMTIGGLKKMTEDYQRLEKENTFMKAKYPKAKEELEAEDFDIDKFLEGC